jgi:glutaconate CoA-transferase subunit A
VLPKWVVTHVAEVPNGAHPSYAHDYYERDNAYYREWDAISKDRNAFSAWLAELREGVPA